MIDILEEYKQYVPSKETPLNEPLPDSSETTDTSYITTLLGGDYLSVARVRGAQFIRKNSELEKYRLNSFKASGEDWHAKQALLEV